MLLDFYLDRRRFVRHVRNQRPFRSIWSLNRTIVTLNSQFKVTLEIYRPNSLQRHAQRRLLSPPFFTTTRRMRNTLLSGFTVFMTSLYGRKRPRRPASICKDTTAIDSNK